MLDIVSVNLTTLSSGKSFLRCIYVQTLHCAAYDAVVCMYWYRKGLEVRDVCRQQQQLSSDILRRSQNSEKNSPILCFDVNLFIMREIFSKLVAF